MTQEFQFGAAESVPPRWTGNGPNGYGTYLLTEDGKLGNFIGDPRSPSTPTTPNIDRWTGNGPQGYGTYNLNPDGSIGTYIGNPQAPQNPTEASKNIRVGNGGLAYVVDNQGNIVRRAPEFDEPSKTKESPGLAAVRQQMEIANLAAGKPAPPAPATAGGTSGATSGGPPSLPPAGGAGSQLEEVRGPDSALGQKGELVGYNVPNVGGGGSRLQLAGSNPNYGSGYTLRSAGLMPSGNAEQDAAAAAGADAFRAQLLSQPGATPLSVQSMFDAINRGVSVPQRMAANRAEETAVNTLMRGGALPKDNISAADFRDYLEPIPQMAAGGSVTANADAYDQTRQAPAANELPIGATGSNFEGNVEYPPGLQGPSRRGERADVINNALTGFEWGGGYKEPVRYVSSQEEMLSNSINIARNAEAERYRRQGLTPPSFLIPYDPRYDVSRDSPTVRPAGFGGYQVRRANEPLSRPQAPTYTGLPSMAGGGQYTASASAQPYSQQEYAFEMPYQAPRPDLAVGPGLAEQPNAVAEPYFDWGISPAGTQTHPSGGVSGYGPFNPRTGFFEPNPNDNPWTPWLTEPGDPRIQFAGGGSFMTNEPIMGMGMQSGQPKFVAGEAGPEQIDVTPTAPMAPPPTPFATLVEQLLGSRGGAKRNKAPSLKPAAAGGY